MAKKIKPEDLPDYLNWVAENEERGKLKKLKTPAANPGQQPKHGWYSFQQN